MDAEEEKTVQKARETVKVMLLPLVVYPFFIPVTPYWSDIIYVLFCGIFYLQARQARILGKKHGSL